MASITKSWPGGRRLATLKVLAKKKHFCGEPRAYMPGAIRWSCTIHVAAAALALLGRPSRRRGPEAEFWHRAAPYCLSGMTLSELASLIWELNWGLRPTIFEGVAPQCTRLLRIKLVAWRAGDCEPATNRSDLHAVLAIGLEGPKRARKFEPRSMLLRDPSENEPRLSTCTPDRITPARISARRPRRTTYVTAAEPRKDVAQDGAVSLRLVAATSVLRRQALISAVSGA